MQLGLLLLTWAHPHPPSSCSTLIRHYLCAQPRAGCWGQRDKQNACPHGADSRGERDLKTNNGCDNIDHTFRSAKELPLSAAGAQHSHLGRSSGGLAWKEAWAVWGWRFHGPQPRNIVEKGSTVTERLTS